MGDLCDGRNNHGLRSVEGVPHARLPFELLPGTLPGRQSAVHQNAGQSTNQLVRADDKRLGNEIPSAFAPPRRIIKVRRLIWPP
jgi:hypothetical protein